MQKYTNLIDAFNASRTKEKGITFVNSSTEDYFVSYEDVFTNARYLLHNLQSRQIKEGDFILFQLSSLERFITLFWACVMGKIVPVPLEIATNQDKALKFYNISNILERSTVITDEENVTTRVSQFIKDHQFLDFLNQNHLFYKDIEAKEKLADLIPIEPDDLCYIQFSSGSTGLPKGVPLTHKNILTNVYDFVDSVGITRMDSYLSWKPLVHDFSMTAFHITPMVIQANHYRIPTEVFVKNPGIWMSTANKFRISIVGSPNFGFRHFLKFYQRSSDYQQWDLSCIRLIQNGAETISYKLLQEFFDEMAPYKLKKLSLMAGYGLAEATLIVTHCPINEPLRVHTIDRRSTSVGNTIKEVESSNPYSVSFVDCGFPLPGNQLIITDAENHELPERTVGHVKVKGDNVISAYYKDEESTQRVIQDGWVDTGDLGFLHEGRFTFTGRAKEIIVLNGVNYYPYDIEEVLLNELNYDELNKYVACGVHDPLTEKEELVIFTFHKGNIEAFAPVASKVKQVIMQKMGLLVSRVIPVKQVPKTTSGKIRRHQLVNNFLDGEYNESLRVLDELIARDKPISIDIEGLTKEKLTRVIQDKIEIVVGSRIEDTRSSFFDLGIKSMHIVSLKDELEAVLQVDIEATDLFDYPSIEGLANYIGNLLDKKKTRDTAIQSEIKQDQKENTMEKMPIAIIGMSCRFPGGSNSIEEFWNTLVQGVDGIIPAPADRWNEEEYLDKNLETPGKMYTSLGGFINAPIRDFDAQFFNIPPKEAKALDPQQRLLLEVSWEAFEDAGIDPLSMMGTETGVYLGMSGTDYSRAHVHSNNFEPIDAYSLTGSTFSTACGRLSYFYGLHGPSFTLDTACSSGLVALHCAFQSIRRGESKMALVGSSHLMLGPEGHIGFSKLGAISPDGHSKAFDDSANGYGRSEGCSVIILKPLQDAMRDGDRIQGVILGTAVNQDGKSAGLTAPNGLAQQRVIWSALNDAGLEPADVDYIEAHGTGTPLGDPIEVNAITEVYGKGHSKADPLMLGSVKSNIGHLEPVAGLAGITKILLSMQKGLIPSNLNFNKPNKLVDWAKLPVRVIDEHTTWMQGSKRRRAGINSFGFGGTNAHAIIEERPIPVRVQHEQERPVHLLNLSAKTPKALKALAQKYLDLFEKTNPGSAEIGNICYTANTGRAHFGVRVSIVGKDAHDFVKKIHAFLNDEEHKGLFTNLEKPALKNTSVVFLFTGQGSQYIDMGKALHEHNEVFRDAFNACDKLFFSYLLVSIKDVVYGENASCETINRTDYAQPLIFSLEYALFKMWESFGVTPSAIIGHSIGEFAGAVAAGVLTLEDAVKLVAARGRLMHSAPGKGVMAAVFASEDVVSKAIAPYSDKVSVAAVNMKNSIVISGAEKEVEEIRAQFTQQGIETQSLVVSHAFHSPLMEPVLEQFEGIANTIQYQNPSLYYVSTLYGREMETAPDAKYWRSHLRNPVRFYEAIKHVESEGYQVFLEIGATPTLTSLAKRSLENDSLVLVNSLKKEKSDWKMILKALGALQTSGVEIDWHGFDRQYTREKVSLPKYPFQRQTYWMELARDVKSNGEAVNSDHVHPLLGERIKSPALENITIYQKRYTSEEPYFMHEHIIFNTRISPAAAHCSLLFSLVQDLYGKESVELKNVEFLSPLITSETEDRLVQFIVDQNGPFKIVSRDFHNPADSWTEHCRGEMRPLEKSELYFDHVPVEDLKQELTTTVTHEEIYEVFDEIGFSLDEGFRRIMHTWKRGEYGLNLLEAKKDIPGIEKYRVYPGVIDSIFQTQIQLVLDHDHLRQENCIFIPFSFSRLVFKENFPDKIYVYSEGEVQDSFLKSNMKICDEAGSVLMEIKDIVGRKTGKPTLLRELNKGLKNSLYQIEWENAVLQPRPLALSNSDTFVILGDNDAMNISLRDELRQHGATVYTVSSGASFVANSNEFTLDPTSKQDMDELVKTIPAQSTILYGWSAGLRPASEVTLEILAQEQEMLMSSLIHLTQALIENNRSGKTSVKLISRDAVPSMKDNTPWNGSISQGTLLGFLRTAINENPDLWKGYIDVDERKNAVYTDVISEIVHGNEPQVRLRANNGRQVGRFNRVDTRALKPKENISVREEATYLITGGLGDLGIFFTRWLIDQGAKSIVLTGRGTPSGEKATALEELVSLCPGVKFIACDVSNEQSTLSLAKQLDEEMMPVAGIIHAAGYLDDGMLAEQSWSRFEQVFAPKVLGSWNLHKAFEQKDLDFFVLFSSVVSALGNMGQANYSAANEFMTRLAHYRRLNGQKATSINWGPWAEIGMAARQENRGQRAVDRGLNSIHPKDGIALFEQLMEYDLVDPVVINITWPVFSKFVTSSNQPVFSNNMKLTETSSETAKKGPKDDILERLKAAHPDDRGDMLLEYSLKVAARTAGYEDHTSISADVPVMEQGFDSIVAVDIKNNLAKNLDIDLPAALFFNYPSIGAISRHILEEYLKFDDEPTQDTTLSGDEILNEINSLIE